MPGASLENDTFKRGPGGRPTREEAERRHRDLLTTATRLFLEKGWDATSLDEISRVSGVAKRFIYARYPDKAALFIGGLERFIAEQIGTLHSPSPPSADVEAGLVTFGARLLELALQPDVLAFQRLFIAQAPRFPDLAKLFVERNRQRNLGEIARVLAAYLDRGAIEGDLEMRAEQFFILAVGIPQRLAMLVGREPRLEEEQRLRAAVHLFLDGCRSR
jgi:TetR/AcrR family transcriptional repressor of mexJK operon